VANAITNANPHGPLLAFAETLKASTPNADLLMRRMIEIIERGGPANDGLTVLLKLLEAATKQEKKDVIEATDAFYQEQLVTITSIHKDWGLTKPRTRSRPRRPAYSRLSPTRSPKGCRRSRTGPNKKDRMNVEFVRSN
jgi:hypothetical protein